LIFESGTCRTGKPNVGPSPESFLTPRPNQTRHRRRGGARVKGRRLASGGCCEVAAPDIQMPMKRIFITVTNPEFYEVLRDDAEAGETNWTVSRHVKAGDLIALYVAHPICSIVAVGEASTDAEYCDDPANEWFGHYFIDIHGLRMLPAPVTRKRLLDECSGWRWPKMPGTGVRVPDAFLSTVGGMLA
jgi:hypothetical protein